jgi:hypothetical protein
MWDTVAGVAHVLCLATGNVEVDPQQNVLLYKINKAYTDVSAIAKKRTHCSTMEYMRRGSKKRILIS